MPYPLSPPTQLLGGSYIRGEPIGAGGMGVVYTGTQPALQRQVAIKILHRDLVTNPDIVEHFRREALVASRVTHPNLVSIFDIGELEDGTPFLVMELVPGRPLGELVRERLLPLEQSVRITRQVLAALAATHRCNIVHADVKSDNVLLHTAPDGSDRIKLIDFGLACIGRCDHRTDDGDGNPVVTGTPDFMAPEVIRGEAPGVAGDLYGVGVMLYELLTGGTPFGGGSASEIMMRHLDTPVVPPSLRRRDRAISPTLDDFVLRALAKDPAARFRDADEMSRGLQRAARIPTLGPCWCHTCGASLASETDHCASCGASIPAAPELHPFGHELNTQINRPVLEAGSSQRCRSHAPSPAAQEERALRADVGRAIRMGAAPAMAEAYRALSRHLTRRGNLIAAAAELREGLDVLTGGGGDAVCPVAVHQLETDLSQVTIAMIARHSDDKPTLSEAAAVDA